MAIVGNGKTPQNIGVFCPVLQLDHPQKTIERAVNIYTSLIKIGAPKIGNAPFTHQGVSGLLIQSLLTTMFVTKPSEMNGFITWD